MIVCGSLEIKKNILKEVFIRQVCEPTAENNLKPNLDKLEKHKGLFKSKRTI